MELIYLFNNVSKETTRAVLQNIQNNDAYLHLGEDMYRNLRTGKEGEIKPELATSIFNLNVPLTVMLAENPILETMIKKLNLRITPNNIPNEQISTGQPTYRYNVSIGGSKVF